ncbi:MAG: hypothetical protein RBS51_01990 [Anaerovoracaceae bacterium]|jgi:hypothetical protein|nr:hypothetical protein [Anaerovoracaceae bacterium]
MKQIIVLVAMIALGVTIAAIIAGFGGVAEEMAASVIKGITPSSLGSP